MDYDATDDLVHGEQECRRLIGFYDGCCFLPLYIFCGDQLLTTYLRPSSVAHHARPITKLLVAKIRSKWPNTKIILRADSAFANNRLMTWCEKNDVGYVFGLQKNSVLIEKILDKMQEVKDHYTLKKEKAVLFQWLRYRAEKWKKYRWVIGKAEHCDKCANPRFVITNLPSSDGVIDDIYRRVKQEGGRKVRPLIQVGIPCSVSRNPQEFYQTLY